MNSPYFRLVRLYLFPLLVASLAAIVYSNSLECAWQFDDHRSILEFDYANATLRSIFAFSPQRSLGFISFWLNYRACGYNLPGWHLVNITIHIFNALLIYLIAGHLLARATRPLPGAIVDRFTWTAAALVAILFAVHPLQTQAVTYIVQRLELLGTLWVLCAFYAAIRALNCPSRLLRHAWAACATLALAAGALSKEIIAAAPLLIALYLVLLHARSWRARCLALLWCTCIGLLLVAIALVFFRALTFSPLPKLSFAPFEPLWQGFTPASYYPLQPRVLLLFLRLCFLPYNLRAEYELDPPTGWADPRSLAALAIHVVLIAGAALLWRRRPLALFGLLWFYVFLLPSLIMPNGIFEHRVYGALAGPLIALASLFLDELIRLPASLRRLALSVVLTLCAGLVICFAFLTYIRNTVWASELSLWLDTVRKSPNSWRANANAGHALMNHGDYDLAQHYLEKAFALNSNVYLVASNLGVLYFNTHNYQRSVDLFSYALSLKPASPLLLYYLGAASVRTGDFHRGTNLLHHAALPAAWTALGDLFYERNELSQALSFYQRALDKQPHDLDAVAGKLRTLLALGHTNAANALILPNNNK